MSTRLLFTGLVLGVFLPLAAQAADYTMKAGSTNVSVYFIINSPNGVPISVGYTRNGQAPVALTPGTELASATSGHADNGWKVVQPDIGTLALSVVRYDLPDAVCASGASSVVVYLYDDNPVITSLRIDLVGYDPTATAIAANVTQFGGAGGTFSGGRPEVNLTHVGGTALGTDGANNMRGFFTSGYGPLVYRGTVASVTSSTVFVMSGPFGDINGLANGCTIVVHGIDEVHKGVRTIVSTEDSGGNTIVTIDSAVGVLETGCVVEILPPGFAAPDRIAMNTANTRVATALPNATAGSSGGLFIAGTNAATSIPSGLTANITGNLSGSVSSVTGNIGGNVTGNVGGNVTGSVGSISGVTFPANFSGLTITSGRVNADITHWLGQDVPTPTVAGVPEVDITHVSGTPVCR